MADLLRHPDENDYEYHKRLIMSKKYDKSFAGIDFSTVGEYAYGVQYNDSSIRKMMVGSRATIKLIEKCGLEKITDDELLKKVQKEKIELQKQRKEFSDQKREWLKTVTEQARFEHLQEVLKVSADSLNGSLRLFNGSTGTLACDTECDGVLVFTDWHFGMTCDNIFNKYDTTICQLRLKKIVESTIKRIKVHKCNNLHIIVLGDLIHGAIHTSARVASEELVADQIMKVSEMLAQSVCELSKYVNKTDVYMTYGNHARVVPNKNDNIHRDNFERLIPWWLSQRLSDCRNIFIHSPSDNEIMFINILGHSICATHGDLDKVKQSPRLLSTLAQKTLKIDLECIILGDKHHTESYDKLGIRSMICGALCGSDDYANSKRLFSTPTQKFFTVTAEDGIDSVYDIKADIS